MGGSGYKHALAVSKGKQPVCGEANFNFIYGRCKFSATQRGKHWGISKEEFRKLTSSKCFYCGAKPSNISKRSNRVEYGSYRWNGLDRIDNSMAYVIDNIVPCCAMCNRMRMAHTQEEFLAKVKDIYEHLSLGEPMVDVGQRGAR